MGGLTSLLLLLCVGVTASTVLDLQKRILGGGDCPSGERGYHVKLVSGTDELICGGSLLKNDWILTAAHCWVWNMTAVIVDNRNIKHVLIKAAPVMYEDDKNGIHDIMLLKLPESIKDIKPVNLPDCKKHKPKQHDTVKIAGSVLTTKGDEDKRECESKETLQCADIKLTDCKNLKTEYKPYSYNHWFCGDTSTVDICPGDAGGGVVFGNMIHGVIAFMGDSEKANAADVAFMDVCEYKDWIEEKTKKGFFSFG